MKSPFISGRTYYLKSGRGIIRLSYISETESDYIFLHEDTLWGKSKDEVVKLLETGELIPREVLQDPL